MITKGNAILFKCEDCNFSGKTHPALKRHRTMAHGLPKLNLKRARSVYKCNICTLTVDNEEKLKNHKKTQHEKMQRSDSTTASSITSPPKKTPKINESSLKKKTNIDKKDLENRINQIPDENIISLPSNTDDVNVCEESNSYKDLNKGDLLKVLENKDQEIKFYRQTADTLLIKINYLEISLKTLQIDTQLELKEKEIIRLKKDVKEKKVVIESLTKEDFPVNKSNVETNSDKDALDIAMDTDKNNHTANITSKSLDIENNENQPVSCSHCDREFQYKSKIMEQMERTHTEN